MNDNFLSNAIIVLLQDKELKQALIDAITPPKTPDQWIEVWWQESETARLVYFDNQYDHVTGLKVTHERMYLRLTVFWDEMMHIGKITAYYHPMKRNQEHKHFTWYSLAEPMYTYAFSADNYTDAILMGQAKWQDVVTKWMDATNEVSA